MSPSQSASFQRNQLLAALPPDQYRLVEREAKPLKLELRQVLIEPDEPITTLYFPLSGFVSLVDPREEIEVGLIGREGVVGVSAVLGVERTPLRAVCQSPGEAMSFPVGPFVAAAQASPALLAILLKYVHAFTMQITSTLVSNASRSLEQRLARWLLMSHDRVDEDDLMITHEFLATMLGVRRPGVTVATHVLEGLGMIKAVRGRISIVSRSKLQAFAEGSYGVAETEYDRVIGPPLAT